MRRDERRSRRRRRAPDDAGDGWPCGRRVHALRPSRPATRGDKKGSRGQPIRARPVSSEPNEAPMRTSTVAVLLALAALPLTAASACANRDAARLTSAPTPPVATSVLTGETTAPLITEETAPLRPLRPPPLGPSPRDDTSTFPARAPSAPPPAPRPGRATTTPMPAPSLASHAVGASPSWSRVAPRRRRRRRLQRRGSGGRPQRAPRVCPRGVDRGRRMERQRELPRVPEVAPDRRRALVSARRREPPPLPRRPRRSGARGAGLPRGGERRRPALGDAHHRAERSRALLPARRRVRRGARHRDRRLRRRERHPSGPAR